MNDLLAWFGLKRFPFDKNIKIQEVLKTEPLKEAIARLEYIKRRGGILLLTGDPGVGKTLALRTYVDSLNENLFRPPVHTAFHLEPSRSALSSQSFTGAATEALEKCHLLSDPAHPLGIQRAGG